MDKVIAMLNEKPNVIFEIIYETVRNKNNILTVSFLCKTANVSRSGYYRWVNAKESRERREIQDRSDFELILEEYNYRGYKKGARSIYMRLINKTPKVIMNIKKIRRLMKKYNLFCPIRKANPYRRMAKAMKTNNYASNILDRQFETKGPRSVLLTDITYIPYNNEFAYLSPILDACTKEILAYQLSNSLEIDFVLNTVQKLIADHKDELMTDTLIHSDQGCHYTSHKFIELVNDSGLTRSMSRRGNCWDNAPQESFFGHMKDEIGDKVKKCKSFDEIKAVIDDWIDYYNNDRYIWKLGMRTPKMYYEYLKNTGNNSSSIK